MQKQSKYEYFRVDLLHFISFYGNAKLICSGVFDPVKFFSTKRVVILEISPIVNLRWSNVSRQITDRVVGNVRNIKSYMEIVLLKDFVG